MAFVVCTLFENHYHYGVAALINSLHHYGYKGDVYAGYQGELPPWVSGYTETNNTKVKNAKVIEVAGSIKLYFLPIDTEYHLTNYKPWFLLQIMNEIVPGSDGIVYFDPDIIIKCQWRFFEKWIFSGVALVHEIVSNDMPLTHPIRLEWKQVIAKKDKHVVHEITSYINGGFCGIARKNIEFLHNWQMLIETAIDEYGCNPKSFLSYDRTYPFWSIDQDAINIAAMCSTCPISEMGPEAMDFIDAGWTMSHATGTPKPWKKKFLSSILRGKIPSKTDKLFWQFCRTPIPVFSSAFVFYKIFSIRMAVIIGRFYKKN